MESFVALPTLRVVTVFIAYGIEPGPRKLYILNHHVVTSPSVYGIETR